MATYQLTEFELLSLLPSLTVMEAERSILLSALEKEGSFAAPVQFLLHEVDGDLVFLLIFDGWRIYPVGRGGAVPVNRYQTALLPHYTGIMGNRESCAALLAATGSTVMVKPKDFRILHRSTMLNSPTIPPISMKFVETEAERWGLSQLRAEFSLADSGSMGDPEKIYTQLKTTYKQLLPAILTENGEIVGMVNSHYHAPEVAMVNMVYLKPDYRGGGRARAMMLWYQSELFKRSEAISLFHTPDNEPARKLYEGLGYKKIDEWVINC